MKRARAVIFAAALCLIAIALAGPAWATEPNEVEASQSEKTPDEPEATATASKSASDEQLANSADVPKFLPPKAPYPRRRVGSGTRGVSAAELTGIEALVPERVGLTLEKAPVLYWFAPKQLHGRAELKVIRENGAEPLLEAIINGPFHPGVQRIRLADHGVSLRSDVTYLWFVTVIPTGTRRSDARTIGGGVHRVESAASLQSKLEAAPAARVPHVLAEAGIWYDAVDALSKRVDAAPGNANLRNQRAALFEQVGLTKPALHERSAGGSGRR
jgi:hypothetical protein